MSDRKRRMCLMKNRFLLNKRWELSRGCADIKNFQLSTLFHAAIKGYTAKVEELLTAKVDVNARSDDGSTTLMMASYRGYLDIVKKLIAFGADVNLQNKNGINALMMAVKGMRINVINELLGVKNIDLNQKDIISKTALIIAIDKRESWGREEAVSNEEIVIAKKLIAAGVDINLQDEAGTTVLMLAAKYSLSELVTVLLERGADINKTDHNGNVALLFAKKLSIIKSLLLKGANINIQNNEGMTLLMHIIRFGDLKDVKELLALGADPNIKCFDNRTSLMIACDSQFSSSPEIVKELLIRGVDPNLQDKHGVTAVMCALQTHEIKTFELLVKHPNIDLTLKDENDMTVLMYAAKANLEGLKILLNEKNLNVNEQNKNGLTALMVAAGYLDGNTLVCVDEIVDEYYKSDDSIYRYGTNLWRQILLMSLLSNDADAVTALLAAGADPNIQDKNWMTALMYAVNSNCDDIVKVLISDDKVDPNITNKDGKTALMFAVIKCNIKIIKLLLSHNEIRDIWDKTGMSASMLASQCGYDEIKHELFQKYGDDSHEINNKLALLCYAPGSLTPN